MDGVMNKCAYLRKALIATMEGARGAEGSVTVAAMWVYDSAARADIDGVNGTVSTVQGPPLRRDGRRASAGTKTIDCFNTVCGRHTKQTLSFQSRAKEVEALVSGRE